MRNCETEKAEESHAYTRHQSGSGTSAQTSLLKQCGGADQPCKHVWTLHVLSAGGLHIKSVTLPVLWCCSIGSLRQREQLYFFSLLSSLDRIPGKLLTRRNLPNLYLAAPYRWVRFSCWNFVVVEKFKWIMPFPYHSSAMYILTPCHITIIIIIRK